MRRIAFYGKGGIGKSTVASNIAYLSRMKGRRVLQIGCDPKHDSCLHHVAGDAVVTAMQLFKTRRMDDPSEFFSQLLMKGRNGVDCIEAGGPEPGTGCAGRAISLLLDLFDLDSRTLGNYDWVVYDVLGDVVCGGFATPIRKSHAEELYVVSSGEPMALYAANNIVKGFVNLASEGGARVAGLVGNLRGIPHEVENLQKFSDAIGVPLLACLPRHEYHIYAEVKGGTVCEFYPDSEPARAYEDFFSLIDDSEPVACGHVRPMPDDLWRRFVLDLIDPVKIPD